MYIVACIELFMYIMYSAVEREGPFPWHFQTKRFCNWGWAVIPPSQVALRGRSITEARALQSGPLIQGQFGS